MTNTELIQKIKAEIDKRYAEYREKMKSDDFTYYEGMADALDLFEQFLDSLESEKPMNQEGLDEEYKDYVERDPVYSKLVNRNAGLDIARHFAKWGAEQSGSSEIPNDLEEAADEYEKANTGIYPEVGQTSIRDAFIDGAKWQKEQMMKEAVEGENVKDINNKLAVTAKNVNLDKFKFGDKVRIIIVKENGK